MGNNHTHEALYVEQKAVYECKRQGEAKLCNAIHCESISWSPTLADNRVGLENRYAAKQHLVHSIWHMHKGDHEWGILKQWPTLDITHSIRYQVQAQVYKVKSQWIHSVRDYIAEVYNLHRIESGTDHLEFIHSLLADNKHLFPSGRACGRWCTQSKSNAETADSCKQMASDHFTSCRKQGRGWSTTNFMLRPKTAVNMVMLFIIPRLMTRTVIYHCHWSSLPALCCTMLSWRGKITKVFIRKHPSQGWKQTDLIAGATSTTRITRVRMDPAALQRVASC